MVWRERRERREHQRVDRAGRAVRRGREMPCWDCNGDMESPTGAAEKTAEPEIAPTRVFARILECDREPGRRKTNA